MTRTIAGLAVAVLVSAGACEPGQPAVAHQSAAQVHTFAGGYAGTVLTDAAPPAWAQGGWNVAKGRPWGVPWALGSGGQAVAFVFARELVAAASPPVDCTPTKALWGPHATPPPFSSPATPPPAPP